MHATDAGHGLSMLVVQLQEAMLAYCQNLHVHISTSDDTSRALLCCRAQGQHNDSTTTVPCAAFTSGLHKAHGPRRH